MHEEGAADQNHVCLPGMLGCLRRKRKSAALASAVFDCWECKTEISCWLENYRYTNWDQIDATCDIVEACKKSRGTATVNQPEATARRGRSLFTYKSRE